MKRNQNKTKLKKYPRDVQYLLDLGYRYAVEMPAFLKVLNQYLEEKTIGAHPVALAGDQMTTFIDLHQMQVYDACHMAHRFDSKLRAQHLYHKRASLATVYFMVASVAGIKATRTFMESVYSTDHSSRALATLRTWLCDRGWRLKKEQWLQVTVAEEVAAWITTWNNLQSGSLWSLNLGEMTDYPVPLKLRQRTMPREIDSPMKKEQARKTSNAPKRAPRLPPLLKRKHYIIPGHLLVADAATVLDCGHGHLYKWIKSGYLTGKKPHAGGLWQVPATEIENMCAGRDPKEFAPSPPTALPKEQKDIRNKQLPLSASIKRTTALDEISRVCDLDDIIHLCTVVQMLPMLEVDDTKMTLTSKSVLCMAREMASKLQDIFTAAEEDDMDDFNLDDDDDTETGR